MAGRHGKRSSNANGTMIDKKECGKKFHCLEGFIPPALVRIPEETTGIKREL
jgi:hypothetical protein